MSETEVKRLSEWFEQADQQYFWENFAPDFSISDLSINWKQDTFDFSDEELNTYSQMLREEGYFRIAPLFSREKMQELTLLMKKVRELTGQAVFSFLYDPFWQMQQKLSFLLEHILGDGYKVLPCFWAWWIRQRNEDAGWPPHRDRDCGTLLEDGMPKVISLWIPLTDATSDNGCIYVLPASRDIRYQKYDKKFARIKGWEDIRALPAQAGSVLCWTHHLLHWGARSSSYAKQPRVSLAFEIQRRDARALEKPLLSPEEPPNFESRLGLIALQLLRYKHMNPISPELEFFCKRWKQLAPQKRSFANIFQKLKKSQV